MKYSLGLFLMAVLAATSTYGQDRNCVKENAGLCSVIQELDKAWNIGDGDAWASHYTEDGEFINILGTIFKGRDSVARHHNEILSSTFKGSNVKSRIRRILWVGSGSVIVDTDFFVYEFERLPKRLPRIREDGSMAHRLKHILVKQDGHWRIVASQNTPLMPLAPARL